MGVSHRRPLGGYRGGPSPPQPTGAPPINPPIEAKRAITAFSPGEKQTERRRGGGWDQKKKNRREAERQRRGWGGDGDAGTLKGKGFL